MRDESADHLLRAYLSADTEAESEIHLTRILDEVACPLVERIVFSVLRKPAARGDAEDVVSDTLTHLLRRLRDLKREREGSIHDLRAYIATCAHNHCHDKLRERYPARNRLRNHLHYLLNHDRELALWRSSDDRLVCGPRQWSGQEAAAARVADEVAFAAASDPSAENHPQIARLVSSVFSRVGAPLDLDALVDTIARLINLEQGKTEVPLTSEFASPSATNDAFDLRVSLRELWDDIRQLSLRQRTALLLNLRDDRGGEILTLFPQTRTATIAEIAEALQMPLADLARLWRDLPLHDAAIGTLLGATPQQVIKFRRLARERLRRMAQHREQAVRDRKLEAAR